MALLWLDRLTLHVGGRCLFRDFSLQVHERDRIGLIGPNGAGKTSLFRVIMQQAELDQGKVVPRKYLRIGYLPQNVESLPDQPILDYVLASVPGRKNIENLLQEWESSTQDMLLEDNESARLEMTHELAELQERLIHFDTYFAEHEARRILDGLGFRGQVVQRNIREFSGGFQMRVMLAALLFQRPDVLLLDEPTNHLDMPSVVWLGAYLDASRQPFILICHDREFLNERIQRVISFEPQGIQVFKGNYESYEQQRLVNQERLEKEYSEQQQTIEKAEQFIRRFRAKATKAKAVQSRIRQLDKLETITLQQDFVKPTFYFPPTQPSSREVLWTEDLGKNFGSQIVLQHVQIRVRRGHRIALVGPNGAGKTTLLKILAGELAMDTGHLQYGHHVSIAYYAQHHVDTLCMSNTLFAEVAGLDQQQGLTQVRGLLATLGFKPDDLAKNISVLSGGEKARAALARLLAIPRNLLIMDEPTNHLDLASSEHLAEALSKYDGTLIFASHNKSFVRKLATHIWQVEPGSVREYPGGFDDYLTSTLSKDVQQTSVLPFEEKPNGLLESLENKLSAKERRRRDAQDRAYRQSKLGALKKQVQELEQGIHDLESEQQQRTLQMSEPTAFQHQGPGEELAKAFARDAARLQEMMLAWEKALAQLEEAERQLE